MSFSPAFEAELAAIDAVLCADAEPRRTEVEAEIQALRPRLTLARARGMAEIEAKLATMLSAREKERDAIVAFLTVSPPEIPKPKQRPIPDAPKQPVARVLRARLRTTPIEAPPVEKVPAAPPIPEPTPEPPKPLPREAIRRNQAFAKREREFFRTKGNGRERLAELKGLACEARAHIEASQEADLDASSLWQSLELLREEFDRMNPGGSFFAFRNNRQHRAEVWTELGEAFRLLGSAERCLDWLDTHPDVPERADLVKLAGAAEAWIHRLNDDGGLGFTDEQQRDVHHRVETAAGGEIYVPWWNLGDGRRPNEEVAEAARSLPVRLSEIAKRTESSAKKDDAMGALEGLVESLEADGPVEETLVPAVLRCLDAGIPPSNKKLVMICLPYRSALKEVDDRRVAKLVEYLSKEEALLVRKFGTPPEAESYEEPEDAQLQAVREYLAGKTVLFVGGRRIPEKKREVEQALGLKELLWPDADPDTLVHDFAASALRADVVCYLIRWSRHSYKQVIDFAKAQGKETVVLKAGLGVNRLVHDFSDQLLTKEPAVSNGG
ncbi:hypothetical protein EON82_05505 [bacterium]|nr:MAG: hypothetical protein EON82_05505 [bacterium]